MKWWSAGSLLAAIMLLDAGTGATQSNAKLPLGLDPMSLEKGTL